MNQRTMAAINLRAVLRALGTLPALDPTAAALVQHKPLTIQFSAAGVASVRLVLGNGSVQYFAGAGPADMKLAFPAPVMVNKMFDGSGIPIPTKGITKLTYLTGTFTELTDRLSYFLRPTPDLLRDPEYARINSILTLHVAAYATAEIGNRDLKGMAVAKGMRDGAVVLGVNNPQGTSGAGGDTSAETGTKPKHGNAEKLALTLAIRDHHMRVIDGDSRTEAGADGRYAYMTFANLEAAGQVLRGELASYPAIGRELLYLGGYIPLLDSLNKLLAIVPFYLS
ncbi:MAG: hypothetical protein PUK59_01195 [Actinomycetaceae bacterium]|nr:hypothetical protein [Actinomycetaceae bacterium]MDY5854004.1 hypothetical protein [Arcanobacterium sp.]